MDIVSVALIVLVATLATILTLGVHAVARRAGLPSPRRRAIVIGLATGLALWLGLTAALARAGVLSVWTARPPRVVLLPLTALAAIVFLSRGATFRSLIGSLPPSWPVALQSFRMGVELLLWGLFIQGRVPVQMTFEGRNFDGLVGLSAPVVALLVARDRLGPRGLLVWHFLGLGMLANVFGTAATSLPGPLHLDWPGPPLTAVASFPVVWIPAFFVPLAVFSHIVSIRQTVGRLRAVVTERSLS